MQITALKNYRYSSFHNIHIAQLPRHRLCQVSMDGSIVLERYAYSQTLENKSSFPELKAAGFAGAAPPPVDEEA